MNMHQIMIHSVTAYDRRQQNAAIKNRKRYYNPYALGLYLIAVEKAEKAIAKGMPVADSINGHFNGALARALHKALQTGDTDIDTKRAATFK